MKIFKYFLVLPLFILLISLPANANVRLSTEKFEFAVKPGDNYITSSFTIQNDGQEAIRFKAYPEYFEISENGTILTGIKDKSSNPLENNIRFNPTEFTINPNDSQNIRFTITNVQSLPDGESRAALFLEDVKTKLQALPTNNAKVAANLVIKTRIAVPIYVDKGRVTKVGSIDKLSIEKSKNSYLYNLNVKSVGNSLIRVGGTGQIVKDNQLITEFPINEHPIQGNSTGIFKESLPVKGLNGDQQYTLKISVSYKGQDNKEQVLSKDIPFRLSDISTKG